MWRRYHYSVKTLPSYQPIKNSKAVGGEKLIATFDKLYLDNNLPRQQPWKEK